MADALELVPDLDHLTPQSVQHRIRSLTREQLQTVLEAEQARSARPAVVQALRARIDQLDAGAEPTGGDPHATPSDGPPPPPTDGPGTVTGTDAPPVNPPAHGVPTNPSQPR
jgi:hypothetical protein